MSGLVVDSDAPVVDEVSVPPVSAVTPLKKSQYVPLMVAKIISTLLWMFGLLALALFAFSQLFNFVGVVAEKEEANEQLVQERLAETFPEVQIGTVENMGVVESTYAIVDLFEKNDGEASTYWEFRNILSTNADFFVTEVGSEVVIDSPNQLGSDTIVTLTDGVDSCEILLEGELTAECG